MLYSIPDAVQKDLKKRKRGIHSSPCHFVPNMHTPTKLGEHFFCLPIRVGLVYKKVVVRVVGKQNTGQGSNEGGVTEGGA